MKPGRNDPCPCGSGKKYKHCCLAAEAPSPATGADLTWRRARRALEGHAARMLRFVEDAYGPDTLEEAWDEFAWSGSDFDPETPHIPVFMPWLFHCWSPDPDDTSVADVSLHDVIPTAAFLARKGRHLDPALRRYLESCVNEPLSFHEVLHSDPDSLRLRDLITGEENEVLDRSAAQTLRAGDVVFAQLARFEGIVMLEACSPYAMPPDGKVEVIKLRNHITAGSPLSGRDLLRDWDYELRELYFWLTKRFTEGQLPALRNTDGDELSFQRLLFDIDSPQAAFDALKHLALGASDDELLADAGRDAAGRLERVHFAWMQEGNPVHKSWDNTVLGQIEIEGPRLIVQVNSAARAERARGVVENALGANARYRVTEIQSVERMLAEAGSMPRDEAREAEAAALQELPEVKAHIAALLAKHYEQWVSDPVPALDGRTPLEAVQTAEGRELVEALVADLERGSGLAGSQPEPAVIARLRERLGLTDDDFSR